MFFGRLACGHFAHPDFPTDYSNWNLCCEHRILYKIICMVLIFSPPDKKLNQQKLGAKPVIWCNSMPQSQLLNQPFWQSCFKTHHQVWKPEGRKLCFYKTSLWWHEVHLLCYLIAKSTCRCAWGHSPAAAVATTHWAGWALCLASTTPCPLPAWQPTQGLCFEERTWWKKMR